MTGDIGAACAAIEECYEFLLAYAGQGLAGEGAASEEARGYLQHAAEALAGLVEVYAAAVREKHLEPAGKYAAFLAVLERDARDALAAVDLVLAQRTISSQMVDNLNASIHLRALLTDLFLIDEILKPQRTAAQLPD